MTKKLTASRLPSAIQNPEHHPCTKLNQFLFGCSPKRNKTDLKQAQISQSYRVQMFHSFYKFLVNFVKFVKETQGGAVFKRNSPTFSRFLDFENKGSIVRYKT